MNSKVRVLEYWFLLRWLSQLKRVKPFIETRHEYKVETVWRDNGAQGFVVPYVLFAILVLSLITIFAMDRLNKAVRVTELVEVSQLSSRQIDDAQNRLLYILLAATPMRDGYDLGGGVYGQVSNFNQAEPHENYVRDIWIPNGTWRKIDSVYVSLQDESGLVPINSASDSVLRELLKFAGATQSAARHLSAEVADYVDYDVKIRNGGAERVQYRAAGLREPPNEPMRHWAEIKQLRSWKDFEEGISFEYLERSTTLEPFQQGISVRYVPSNLRPLLEIRQKEIGVSGGDPLAVDLSSERRPSGRVRATFLVLNDHPQIRQVSLSRMVSDFEKPFQSQIVFERAVRPSELLSLRDELKKAEGFQ